MRWNEHVKLVATTFNVVALGVVGVGLVQPYFGASREADGIAGQLDLYSNETAAVIGALAMHLIAHGVLRLLKEDE